MLEMRPRVSVKQHARRVTNGDVSVQIQIDTSSVKALQY